MQEDYNIKAQNQRKKFIQLYNKIPAHRRKIYENYIFKRKQKHLFHIVAPSPWPLFTSISVLFFVLGLVAYMHKMDYGGKILIFSFLSLLICIYSWFRDIVREGTYMGYHTTKVQANLRLGFVLFLASEVMFFFAFFWAYFHFSLCPSIFSGNTWPPEGIVLFFIADNVLSKDIYKNLIFNEELPIFSDKFYNNFDLIESDSFFSNFYDPNNIKFNENSFNLEELNYENFKYDFNTTFHLNLFDHGVLIDPVSVPLLNTIILLTSGAVLTYSHASLRLEQFFESLLSLGLTVLLGIYFLAWQIYEYVHATFSINDGIYGSLFFMMTGFHGFHVLIGTIFLIVCFFRMYKAHFTPANHFGFEAAIWYWHFVDVVWILLYIVVYFWPNFNYYRFSIKMTQDSIFINLPFSRIKPILGKNFVDNFDYTKKGDWETNKELVLASMKYIQPYIETVDLDLNQNYKNFELLTNYLI